MIDPAEHKLIHCENGVEISCFSIKQKNSLQCRNIVDKIKKVQIEFKIEWEDLRFKEERGLLIWMQQ